MSRDSAILFALTSHGRLGDTGRATGFFLPEAAEPWKVFRGAGYRVDLVSPRGGRPPMYGQDPGDPVQREFLEDPQIARALAATPRSDQVDPSGYAAIFYVGGHGTMWDFPQDAALAAAARRIYEAGGVVAAVCHGPAGLLPITLSDGRPLVEGRDLTSFTNEEEADQGLTDVVPFLLSDALEKLGARHHGKPAYQANVVVDGRLITGQNPASSTGVAEAVVAALSG